MKRNVFRSAACAVLLGFTGAACASGGDATDTAADVSQASTSDNASPMADAPGRGAAITIRLISFKPTDVQLAAGGTVLWRQEDVATHTVTSGRVEQSGGTATATPDGRFDSGNISKGQTFEFSFPEPGQYPFFCAIHPATMTGLVTVT